MSYQVLARKWRPQSFEEMVGQSHVLKALSNGLDQGRLHHAYLLTGTRGVGKTTIARILARCFNCETGPTAKPCGECSACTEITEGRSFDLIEVDGASKTKVEDMRELLENVQYAPSQCRYKMYLIDEVHMLSNSSFNALLKTLEEPPPHVVFLFATTHPQKIPPTVLSRCLQFHLKNLQVEKIVEHLVHILKAEKISAEEGGLLLIAKAASGSMRDALSLTDQAIAFGGGEVVEQRVNEMLGTVDTQIVTTLLAAIANNDAAEALRIVAEYAERAADFTGLIDRLLVLLHRIGVEQVLPGAGGEAQLERRFIETQAAALQPEVIQLYYQSLLIGKRDFALAPDPISGLEMLVIRLLAFQMQPPVSDQASRSDSDQGDGNDGGTGAKKTGAKKFERPNAAELTPAAAPPSFPVNDDIPTPSAQARAALESLNSNLPPDLDTTIAPESKHGSPAKENKAEPSTTPNPASESPPDIDDLTPEKWCEIFTTIPLSGVVRTVASYCVPVMNETLQDGDTVRQYFFILEAESALFNEEHPARIEKGLSIYFGRPIKVVVEQVVEFSVGFAEKGIDVANSLLETPAANRLRHKSETHGAALESLEQDPNVLAIISEFDASIDESTVMSTTDLSGTGDA